MDKLDIAAACDRRAMLRELEFKPSANKFDWSQHPMREVMPTPSWVNDAHLVSVSNVPHPDEIEIVKEVFPDAAHSLERWRDTWQANVLAEFPLVAERTLPPKGKSSLYRTEIQFHLQNEIAMSRILSGVIRRHDLGRLIRHDYFARHLSGRQRNYLHHYVDNAYAFLSLAEAEPGMAILVTGFNMPLLYTGIDSNGMLTFEPLSPGNEQKLSRYISSFHEDDGKYWKWGPIVKAMDREVYDAPDHHHAADILLDMADRGHPKAFVKSAKSKGGTWTVNLSGVRTHRDALLSLARDGFDSYENLNRDLIIQEHLPTTREQRYFVSGGRIVAGVCSDRNLNATNMREGRIIDDRVAVIERPEVNGGEFERGQTGHEVNRPLAARFAKLARQIAKEMKAEGRLHYVLDMGLTERGVVAIEINSFFRSGPYCLDHRRVAKAHRRSLTAEQLAQAKENLDLASSRRHLKFRRVA